MKTPEEIKRDAEICINHPYMESCNSCRLYGECHGISDHIVKELYDLVLYYESRLAQVERERNAAVHDILHVLHTKGTIDAECLICDMEKPDCHWECEKAEWRGVCAENTEDV